MNEQLSTLYIKKLQKMLNVEDQIIATLPNLIALATSGDLRDALAEHLEETRSQKARLEDILSNFSPIAGATIDNGFAAMVEESQEEVSNIADPNLRDAAIVAAAQSVEHYEMAHYGSIIDWAKQLGDAPSEGLLRQTLSEEEAADKKLTGIAEGGLFATGVNEMAAKTDVLEE